MQLAVFKYEDEEDHVSNDFTTVEIDGEPWFVAADVCSVLEIQNTTQALQSLDDDEKLTYVMYRAGQNRPVNLINESGLYNLVFRSKKPSAKAFRKWVTKEVIPSIRKQGTYESSRLKTPNFVVRFNDNWDKVDKGYFSVISELFIRLYGQFEQLGYQIPDKAFNGKEIRPDVSVGIRFANYIKKEYPYPEQYFKTYEHSFPNGVIVEARQYKNMLLPVFIRFVDEEWMPNCAQTYFKERDPKALEYLPKLLNPKNKAREVATIDKKTDSNVRVGLNAGKPPKDI